MPKKRKVYVNSVPKSTPGVPLPLVIKDRLAHDIGPKKGRTMPAMDIRCGCCDQTVSICYEEHPTGQRHVDTLEINGVYASVDQWRQILLPILQIEDYTSADPNKVGQAPGC